MGQTNITIVFVNVLDKPMGIINSTK